MDVKEKALSELDRRIQNVQKVADWRQEQANEYFESLKRFVAVNLTIDKVISVELSSRLVETSNAYECWAAAVSELQSLQAMKDDIEKGRVTL